MNKKQEEEKSKPSFLILVLFSSLTRSCICDSRDGHSDYVTRNGSPRISAFASRTKGTLRLYETETKSR